MDARSHNRDECTIKALTARVRSLEAALERARSVERQLEVIVSASSDLYFTLARDGTILDYQVADESELYLPPEKFLGKRMADLLPLRVAERLDGAVRIIDSGKSTARYEYWLTCNGKRRAFEATVCRLDGSRLSMIIRNITPRKAAERALLKSERRFRQIAETIDEIFWIGNPAKGTALYISPAWERMMGTPVETVYRDPKTFLELVHEDDREYARAAYLECLKTGHMNATYRIVRPDGIERWVRSRGFPIYDAKGELYRTSGVTQDITEIKIAEQALLASRAQLEASVTNRTRELALANEALQRQIEDRRRSEEQFRCVADTIPGIIAIHRGGKYLYVNKAAEAITGYTREELLQKNFWEIGTEEYQELLESRARSRLEGTDVPTTYEIQIRKKTGELRWLFLSVAMIDYEGELSVLGTGYDITERKRTELELTKARDLADAANRAKSEFLANMSHEIRTPIGAMMGFAELLQSPNVAPLDRDEYVEGIQRNGQHLIEVINDILDLAKIEAGSFKVSRTRCSLETELASIAAMMRQRMTEKRLSLQIRYDGKVPDSIVTDPTLLRQILINIVGNAAKFTLEGGVEIAIGFSPKSAGSGHDELRIRVRDTGIGIEPDQADHLFQPFSQGEHSFSRRFGGTGLGLTLARRHARALGGDVTLLWSRPGEGSEFLVTLDAGPIGEVEWKTCYTEPPRDVRADLQSVLEHRPLEGARVLLVEDGIDNQVLFTHFLESAGALVDQAENGLQAFHMACRQEYDVVLMDIQLPGLDGYQATRQLRECRYNRPIVALTAHAMKEERERCLAVGCDDCLTKPIEASRLVEEVRKWAHAPSHPRASASEK